MLSAMAGLKAEPTLRINLYPGILDLGEWKTQGAFMRTSPSEGIIAGFSFGNDPLGIGFQGGNDPSYEKLDSHTRMFCALSGAIGHWFP